MDTSDIAGVRAALAFGHTETGDRAIAWLERARKLAPDVPTVDYLAALRLIDLDLERAQDILGRLVTDHPGFREAWLALATCHWRRSNPLDAASCLHSMLVSFAPPADSRFAAFADAVCRAADRPGWLGLDADGGVTLSVAGPRRATVIVALDGNDIRFAHAPTMVSKSLPRNWHKAVMLEARVGRRALLGTPVDLTERRRVEGFVDFSHNNGLSGWAWYPADPDRPTPLTLRSDNATRDLLADDESLPAAPERLLDRRRGFKVPAAELTEAAEIRISARNGGELAGSPLSPRRERDVAAGAAKRLAAASLGVQSKDPVHADPWRPLDADLLVRPWDDLVCDRAASNTGGRAGRRSKIDVVIPVWRGADDLAACLASLVGQMPDGTRVVVVDDASDDPSLRTLLAERETSGAIRIIRHAENRGFPAAANTGMRHAIASNRDVLLLNPDTLLPPGCISRLVAVAYGSPKIASVTPLSNDGSIVSLPSAFAAQPADVAAWDRWCRIANRSKTEILPTAVGFCMFIRAASIAEVGLFREDAFAQGYGEENDWSFRARHLGFRNLAATGVFVLHRGGRSFGAMRLELMRRNRRQLNRLHPGYDADVDSFRKRDPLASARRAIDAARWTAGRLAGGAVILLTHGKGGGVDRFVAERARAIRAAGLRPILLTPDPFPPSNWHRMDEFKPGVRVAEAASSPTGARSDTWLDEGAAGTVPTQVTAGEGEAVAPFADLRFTLPDELDALHALLDPDRPVRVELHHFMGHHLDALALARRLDVPLDIFVHDSAMWCPMVTMLDASNRYCGEPLDSGVCIACERDLGGKLREEISVPALRVRSGGWMTHARHVVVSCEDAARRISRQFPGTRAMVSPWEDDSVLVRALGTNPACRSDEIQLSPTRLRIVATGAIGTDKGFQVLLDCARDAEIRDLALEFILVGFSCDDARLLETGRVFVSGRFVDGEGPSLVAAQRGQLGFIPSVIPETWCYALSTLWAAGLRVACFALGAQAERVVRTGAGAVIPLGLSAPRVNDLLLKLARGVVQEKRLVD